MRPISLRSVIESEYTGSRDGIVATDQQGERMCAGTRRNGLADERRGVFDAEARDCDVPAVDYLGLELATRLDIIAADALERLAEKPRRLIATAGRH